METSDMQDRGELWRGYCDKFADMGPDVLRPGCHPRLLRHNPPSGRALVLVHGLSDSPAFLGALAEHFHSRLGYDVYLPLLAGHGLCQPRGMRGVRLEQWLDNVHFAVATAARGGAMVFLGGLSTGGALALLLALGEGAVDGDLFLFSPALGLADGPSGFPGPLKERLLRQRWVAAADRLLDLALPLVGRHPWRYDRVPLVAAAQLVRLMERLAALDAASAAGFAGRIFAAWSECDRVVSVARIRALNERAATGRFHPFVLPESAGVAHASVVLGRPVYGVGGGGQPLEAANPHFAAMLAAIDTFSAGTSC
jgi:alpha-beta hydrolase superfamily lysophospholipase